MVLWRHILGGYIGGGSAGVGLEWSAGTFGALHLHILAWRCPVYVNEVLQKSQHSTPSRPQHSHHQCNPPKYVSTAPQIAHQSTEFTQLSPPEANTVKQVVGIFLYYVRAVDPTMLLTLNRTAAEQSNST